MKTIDKINIFSFFQSNKKLNALQYYYKNKNRFMLNVWFNTRCVYNKHLFLAQFLKSSFNLFI